MSDKYKYPRTYHLPSSPGLQNDDKMLQSLKPFEGMIMICTEKMDGENTTMSSDYIHARSLDSNDHPSRHYVKGIWGSIKHMIPDGYRICGENMYATHSIHYENLESYFLVFSVWHGDYCLPYDETKIICNDLGLTMVPTIIPKFTFSENIIDNIASEMTDLKEGFVIRNIRGFLYDDFATNVAKWVREKHIQTNSHWMATFRNEDGYINKLKG